MFQIRYKATSGGAYTTLTLHPGPSEVDYPVEKRLYKEHSTQDGATIVQRPLRDSRPRQWIWAKYIPELTVYENQWKVLETLEYRYRLENGLWPVVEVFEDTTDTGGFGRLDVSLNKIWTAVKLLRVDRTVRRGQGRVTYEESVLEFKIDDVNYIGF